MSIENVFEDFQNRFNKNNLYLEGLSKLEREEISNNEKEISIKIKQLLDIKGMGVSDIRTSFIKDYKTKDDIIINAYHTVFNSTQTQRASSVITNATTWKCYTYE